MDKDLKYVTKSIADNTGIEITLVDGEAGRQLKPGKILPQAEENRTLFGFSFRGGEHVAYIKGADRTATTYAYLISGLLENAGSSDLALGMNEYLKKILLGECTKLMVQKFHVKYNVPDIPCYSLVISFSKGVGAEILNVLESYSSSPLDTPIMTDDGNFAFVKFVDVPADIEYQSPGEFAEYLSQSMLEELGVSVKVGVGAVADHLYDLPHSYQQAVAALKMSEVFNSKGSVHSYKEYVLIKMLEDLPRAKLGEYLDILTGEDSAQVFEDPDMLNTAEEFLENSLNVSETSRNLFMHRNTLIYRLDKIEKATGLNIKNFSDAVTFRLITILYKLLK